MIAVPQTKNYLCFVLLTAAAASSADSDTTIFFENQLTADRLVTLVLHLNPGIGELAAAAHAASFSVETAGSIDDPDFSYAFAPRTLCCATSSEPSSTARWPSRRSCS